MGHHRFLKPRRPALPLSEPPERIAEIHLRRRPVEWNTFTRKFLQRGAICRDGNENRGILTFLNPAFEVYSGGCEQICADLQPS